MKRFFELIDRMHACPDAERPALEQQIWGNYGVEKSVLALDMSEFSLSVRRSGIVSYLGLIRRMHVVTRPIVQACGGEVIKYLADNLMAVFPRPQQAVAAAVEINRAIASAQGMTRVSIGIDHGRFLMVTGKDCFGDPVNVAYKLGEDLARPGEILISAATHTALAGDCAYPLRSQDVSISGLQLSVYSVMYRDE
jgi:adenylate cyclase